MPDVYLQPSDLSPAQAQQVLDFLNRATSAEQLNRDIEFPGEPDIGVRLGQRLLDARAALGGAFTALQQVRSVRLIGPERFTEICVAALGLDPARWVDLFFGASPLGVPTETGLAVTLDVRPQPAWLGQRLALTVRVADLGGTPRAGVAVTVHTGAGKLLWMYGYQRIEGAAVTVLTGADGSAELELSRDPSEPLSDVQQAALEAALAPLDARANDPLKLEGQFHTLAALYLNERSYNLRRAVDIHVRDQRDATLGALNSGTWRLAWPVDSVLLQADVLAGSGGGSAVARAVTTVLWKNWVGAWIEFFGDVLAQRGNLDAQFGAGAAGAKGAEVVGDLLARAQRFVAGQSGRTALWLGQRKVESAARRLVSGDLGPLNADARAALLTQLEPAAQNVGRTALGSFTLVSSATRALDTKIASVGSVSQQAVAHVDAQAAHVDQVAQQVSVQSAQVNSNVTAFNTSYAQFNVDYAKFTNVVLTLPPGVIANPVVGPGAGGLVAVAPKAAAPAQKKARKTTAPQKAKAPRRKRGPA